MATYSRFIVSGRDAASVPTTRRRIDITSPNVPFEVPNTYNFNLGAYTLNSTGAPTAPPLQPLSSFVIDSSSQANYYVSTEITDGASGNIVGAGSKPQNWGYVYFGITYQDSTYWDSYSGNPDTGHTLASNNVIWYLDFDDYPAYGPDLVRAHNGYTYQVYSADNPFGFSFSRSSNTVTVKAYNPSDNSIFYTRSATVDPTKTVRVIMGTYASSSNVYGTYNIVSQSGNYFLGAAPTPIPPEGVFNGQYEEEIVYNTNPTATLPKLFSRQPITITKGLVSRLTEDGFVNASTRLSLNVASAIAPYDLVELNKMQSGAQRYTSARMIDSSVSSGGGGGTTTEPTSIQTWY